MSPSFPASCEGTMNDTTQGTQCTMQGTAKKQEKVGSRKSHRRDRGRKATVSTGVKVPKSLRYPRSERSGIVCGMQRMKWNKPSGVTMLWWKGSGKRGCPFFL